MRRCPTRWLRPRPSAALLAGLALALGGCVTRGAYGDLQDERDRIEIERDRLAARVEVLETSNETLVDERKQLFGEIEDLRGTKEDLDRDVVRLREAHEQLQAALSDREARLAEREHELGSRADALAAQEQEIARLRATYDGLVADLESEIAAKSQALDRMRGGERMAFPSEALFEPDSLAIHARGRGVLEKLAARLARLPDRIEVHGHTDLVPVSGPLAALYPSNWEVAGAMAAGVARVLVEAGVDPRRVIAVSHGAQVPVASNESPETRAQNRRIEIRLVQDGGATATGDAPRPPSGAQAPAEAAAPRR
jgi:chemotaxis protein MotB